MTILTLDVLQFSSVPRHDCQQMFQISHSQPHLVALGLLAPGPACQSGASQLTLQLQRHPTAFLRSYQNVSCDDRPRLTQRPQVYVLCNTVYRYCSKLQKHYA